MMRREFPIISVLEMLEHSDLLPGLVFRTSRRQCDVDIERLDGARYCLLSGAKQDKLRAAIDAVVNRYQFEPASVYEHAHYGALIRTGSGAHHAGQLLVWRILLEELMSAGMLRLMIATGTVAAGVDFPARSVVISAHSKVGSDGFNILAPSEFQQMAGRAGRRGKDFVGFCLMAPSPFCDARLIREVAKRPPEPLRSAYFAAPATVLNLLKFRSASELRFLVERSFAAFLDGKQAGRIRKEAEGVSLELAQSQTFTDAEKKRKVKRVRRLEREADELANRQITLLEASLVGLERLGHMAEGRLTDKGRWAAQLCTGLVLEFAEAIERGLFDGLDSTQLAGVVGAISGDSYRQYFNLRKNPIPVERFKALEEVVGHVRSIYQSPLNTEVGIVPDAGLTVLTWLESADWIEFSGLLRLAKVAEGDVARLVNQTADHLNHIARLTETHPELARTAEEARLGLLRPPLVDTLQVLAARGKLKGQGVVEESIADEERSEGV